MTENASLAALKPCPFCGHPPVLRQIKNDGRWIADCNTVTCIRPTTGLCRTEAEAVAAWNTRAPEAEATELRAEIARLRKHIADQANSINIVGSHYADAITALDGMVHSVKRNARAALRENTDG